MKSRIVTWLMVFVMGVFASVIQTVYGADIVVDSYTKTGLPVAGTAGRLARVTDNVRGLWMDQGSQFFSTSGDVVNVKEFGANGEDTVDDEPAFRNAIDAVPAGGTLWIPSGTYYINNTLRLKNRITIKGVGTLSWRGTTPNAPLFTRDDGADLEYVRLTGFKMKNDSGNAYANAVYIIFGVRRCEFTYLEIEGFFSSIDLAGMTDVLKEAPIPPGTGLETPAVFDGGNIVSHNLIYGTMVVDSGGGDAIRVDSSFSDISHNRIINANEGILVAGDGTRIVGNYIANLYLKNCIYLSGVREVTVAENYMYNGANDGVAVNGSQDVTITGNIFRHVKLGAVRIQNSSRVTVSNNNVQDSANLVRFAQNASEVSSTITISGNTFDSSLNGALSATGPLIITPATGGTLKGVVISENVFSNVTNTNPDWSKSAIYVTNDANLDDIVISKNIGVTNMSGVDNFIYQNKIDGRIIVSDNITSRPINLRGGTEHRGNLWNNGSANVKDTRISSVTTTIGNAGTVYSSDVEGEVSSVARTGVGTYLITLKRYVQLCGVSVVGSGPNQTHRMRVQGFINAGSGSHNNTLTVETIDSSSTPVDISWNFTFKVILYHDDSLAHWTN